MTDIEKRLADIEDRLSRLEADKREVLTIQGAAAFLGVNEQHVYKLVREGKLIRVKDGRRFTRFLKEDLLAYLRAHRVE